MTPYIVGSIIAFGVLTWITLPWTIYYFPRSVQAYFYGHWKQRLIEKSQNTHPLVSYPMLMFIELQLDGYFAKGGLKCAEKARAFHVPGHNVCRLMCGMCAASMETGNG